jgi:hypothetical protein
VQIKGRLFFFLFFLNKKFRNGLTNNSFSRYFSFFLRKISSNLILSKIKTFPVRFNFKQFYTKKSESKKGKKKKENPQS